MSAKGHTGRDQLLVGRDQLLVGRNSLLVGWNRLLVGRNRLLVGRNRVGCLLVGIGFVAYFLWNWRPVAC